MIKKLIKFLLILQMCLFTFNVSNYLMLLNTEYYQYFLLQGQNKHNNVIQMFSFHWSLLQIVNILMFLIIIVIFLLQIMNLKNKESKE